MSRSVTVVGLGVLFAVLVVVTIAGVATNWPQQRSLAGSAQFAAPKTDDATVVGIQTVRCSNPTSSGCESVRVRLTSGPNKGRRASLLFGEGGGAPSFGLGERVLVYKNKLPPHNDWLGGPHVPAYG